VPIRPDRTIVDVGHGLTLSDHVQKLFFLWTLGSRTELFGTSMSSAAKPTPLWAVGWSVFPRRGKFSAQVRLF
jgi:hypothetical protein